MPLAFESEKTMFEIYRDPTWSGKYRVVYFTELNDNNREKEFNHAMRGEHFIDGYLRNYGKEEAKGVINGFIERLNAGEKIDATEVKKALEPYTA
jgi:hypothetical protein